MGVSLSLEGPRQARARRRGGQHTRTADEQASLDAFAAFLNGDALSAARCLSRVSDAVLASRLLPAARALARASELVLASDPVAIGSTANDFVISPACLLGRCEGSASMSPCRSLTCQHSCHPDAAGSATQSLPGAALPGPALPGPVLAGTVLPEGMPYGPVLPADVLGGPGLAEAGTPWPVRTRRGSLATGRTRRRAS